MIKYAALISILAVIGAESQRPPYAGSPNRYPQVLPRFKDQTSTTTPDPTIVNRVGENENDSVPTGTVGSTAAAPVNSEPTTSTTPSPLPFSELGFGDVVDKVKDLPEEQQPYWYINRHQIAQHLNPVGGTSQNNFAPSETRTRSSFTG